MRRLLCALLFFPCLTLAGPPLTNHPSPYVRMHADDAVRWQLLDEQLLVRAKKENKLLFISIGYFACHWCHVMREESFDNREVAEILNSQFIPVKIDRELNPVLDGYLMDFLQHTRGYGGWPLNVFLTPDGYPLLGLVYLPQAEFLQLLNRMQGDWKSRPTELNQLAEKAFRYTERSRNRLQPALDADELTRRFMQEVHAEADDFLGGFGEQSKFPRPTLLLSLLDVYADNKDPWLKEFLQLTLRQMSEQGLHDVIGGGFFRYVTDPQWHVPHFEKMLYTNAGLVQVYARAYELFGEPRYLQVAEETMTFILRDMNSDQGLISALSALDGQGVEGGYYLWQAKSLQQALDPQQWLQVNQHWKLSRLDGGLLPVGFSDTNSWQAIKQQLIAQRNKRVLPRDEKILLSWNGYALSALAAVSKLSPRPEFRQQGQRLFGILSDHQERGLQRSTSAGPRMFLEDQVLVLKGLWDWAKISERSVNKAQWLDQLKTVMDTFWNEQGWRLSDASVIPLPGRQFNIADAQLPAADAIAIGLLLKQENKDSQWFTRVLSRYAAHMDERMLANPLAFASHVSLRRQLQALMSRRK